MMDEYQGEIMALNTITGSQALLMALDVNRGRRWPCGHMRVPDNTHRVDGTLSCRVCRRRSIRDMLVRLDRRAKQRRAREKILRECNRKASQYARIVEQAATASTNGRLPFEALTYGIAKTFDITVEEIFDRRRTSERIHARAVMAVIMRQRGLSYTQLGRLMAGRDHSTVMNLVRNIGIYERRDPRVSEALEAFGD